MPEQISQELADKLCEIACKQRDVSQEFKREKMEEAKRNEELYANKAKKPLRGQYNIPLPIMSGFVDTFQSKIDEPVKINFGHQDEADLRRAMKTTAAWEKDSGADQGKWNYKDRAAKKLALFCGRAFYKYWAYQDPEYRSEIEVIDYMDFDCEPGGKHELDKHLFVQQQNIFRTKSELERGMDEGIYVRQQVAKLIRGEDDKSYKETEDEYSIRQDRYNILRLDPLMHNYVGEDLFNFTEANLVYQGKRYYLLFNPKSKIWVRAKPLKELFTSEKWPFASWATHDDLNVFWSKAPCDDIRPIHEAIRIAINEAFNNLRKRNWDMTAFDPEIFPDPEQLIYKQPNQLVIATPKDGKPIQSGIYKFETPDTTNVTIRLVDIVKSYLAGDTGITAGAQGQAEEDKVSIYFGNLQQVADRIGLTSKNYSQAFTDLGVRYYEGLRDNLTEGVLVKMIGEQGVEWDEIKEDDVDPIRGFNITVSGGSAEVRINEVKKKNRQNALDKITTSQFLTQKVNPSWLIQNILIEGDFEDEEVKIAVNVEGGGEKELMSEAAQAIQDIIDGKKPSINRAATPSFMQKILDFATDRISLEDEEVYQKLVAYAKAHTEIVVQNMQRKASSLLALQQQKMLGVQSAQILPQTQEQPEANPLLEPPEGARVPSAPNVLQALQ